MTIKIEIFILYATCLWLLRHAWALDPCQPTPVYNEGIFQGNLSPCIPGYDCTPLESGMLECSQLQTSYICDSPLQGNVTCSDGTVWGYRCDAGSPVTNYYTSIPDLPDYSICRLDGTLSVWHTCGSDSYTIDVCAVDQYVWDESLEICSYNSISCTDGNPLTIDRCGSYDNTCYHFPMCMNNNQCDNGNLCNTYFCAANGYCSYYPIDPGCCLADTGNKTCDFPNYPYVLPCQSKQCVWSSSIPKPNYCSGLSASCDDSDECTVDYCSTIDYTCHHLYMQGCCNIANDSRCDDGDPATLDSCNLTITTCIHMQLGCATNLDCEDMNSCTIDFCDSNRTCQHSSTVICNPPKCKESNCDPSTGLCVESNAPNGTSCFTDPTQCRFGTGTCRAGICIGNPRPYGPNCTTPIDNQPGTCIEGECVMIKECLGDIDCDRGNICEMATCNNETFTCQYVPEPDYKQCELDSDYCTIDLCLNGTCIFHDVRSCDDSNDCTYDYCQDNMCKYTNVTNGSPCQNNGTCYDGVCLVQGKCTRDSQCDDNNKCTYDKCVRGHCQNRRVHCREDHDECKIWKCSRYLGCVATNKQDGHPCKDDGDRETADYCVAGVCMHLNMDGDNCLHDHDCWSGHQKHEDGDADDEDHCIHDFCNRTSHKCLHKYIDHCCNSDYECEEGDHCEKERCGQKHRCIWWSKPGCCVKDASCDDHIPATTDKCNTETRTCEYTFISLNYCTHDTDCIDQDACSEDKCNLNVNECVHVPYSWPCQCHVQNDCANLDNPATCDVGFCDAGQCLPVKTTDCVPATRTGATKRDLDAYDCHTYTKSVQTWKGILGEHINDPIFDLRRFICPQLLASYDWIDGPVVSTSLSAQEFRAYMEDIGETLNPAIQCTEVEKHSVLIYGMPFPHGPCQDNDLCTTDTCNPEYPYGDPCIFIPKNCDDSDECTDDSCYQGQCINSPAEHHCPSQVFESCVNYECFAGDGLCYALDNDCDQGGPFGHDACNVTLCIFGQWRTSERECHDFNFYTIDECVHPIGSCKHEYPNCIDNDLSTFDWWNTYLQQCAHTHHPLCNASDFCHNTGVYPNCDLNISIDDNNPCTIDSCDPLTGPKHIEKECPTTDPCNKGLCDPKDGQCVTLRMTCDDSDPCTTDVCVGGQCSNTPKDCSDTDPCTTDLCNSVTGDCAHIPNTCRDDDECTFDICIPGEGCINPSIPCLGDVPGHCIVRVCDPMTGLMTDYNKTCDDSNACTTDSCQDGICTNALPPMPPGDVECQTFNCSDPEQGIGAWSPKPAQTPCNLADPCLRYACDGLGFCSMIPGAPAECPTSGEQGGMSAGLILAIVLPTIGVLLLCVLFILLFVLLGRRRRRIRRERRLREQAEAEKKKLLPPK